MLVFDSLVGGHGFSLYLNCSLQPLQIISAYLVFPGGSIPTCVPKARLHEVARTLCTWLEHDDKLRDLLVILEL